MFESYRQERCLKDIILAKKWQKKNLNYLEEKRKENLEKYGKDRPTTSARAIGGWYSYFSQSEISPRPNSILSMNSYGSLGNQIFDNNASHSGISRKAESTINAGQITLKDGEEYKNLNSNKVYSQLSAKLIENENKERKSENIISHSKILNMNEQINGKEHSIGNRNKSAISHSTTQSNNKFKINKFNNNNSQVKSSIILSSKTDTLTKYQNGMNRNSEVNSTISSKPISQSLKKQSLNVNLHKYIRDQNISNSNNNQKKYPQSTISTRSFGIQASVEDDRLTRLSSTYSSNGPGTTISNISSYVPSEVSFVSNSSVRRQIASRMSKSRVFPPTLGSNYKL